MKTFEKKSLIRCSIDELFNFHLNTSNIKRITPKDTHVDLLSKNIVPKVGSKLDIKTTKYFIPTFWRVEISLLNRPRMLVDTAVKSPFKFWRHSHIFTQKEHGCELKDVIEYELPFGFIGEWFAKFIYQDIKLMFDYRHKMTKMILEKESKSQ